MHGAHLPPISTAAKQASTGKWELSKHAAQLQRRFWDSRKDFSRKQERFSFKTYTKSTSGSKDDEAWPWPNNREQPFFTLNSLYLCKLHVLYLPYQQRALSHCQLTDTWLLGEVPAQHRPSSPDFKAQRKWRQPTFQATPAFVGLPYEMPVSHNSSENRTSPDKSPQHQPSTAMEWGTIAFPKEQEDLWWAGRKTRSLCPLGILERGVRWHKAPRAHRMLSP